MIAKLIVLFYNLLPFLGPAIRDPRESSRDHPGLLIGCTDLKLNEAFEDSTRSGVARGRAFASACAMADDSVFTVMDDPSSAKNLSKVLLTPVIWRSPAIRKVPQ